MMPSGADKQGLQPMPTSTSKTSEESQRLSSPLMSTDLPLLNRRTGKVRDLYDLTLPDGSEGLLVVATDRISVFDAVLASGIPGKGRLLTQLSVFWLDLLADVLATSNVSHHLVAADVESLPNLNERLDDEQKALLEDRIMICRKTQVLPIECIVRGYLAGSGLKEYQATGGICGIPLPAGLHNGDQLPEPIFTPSTKAEEGHDENISLEEAAATVGRETLQAASDATTAIYARARDHAADRGIIIADTKLEFGLDAAGQLVLIDEVLTPDSSRFWPADTWQPGREQDSFDKQFVRNYTETLVAEGLWNKEHPGPELPGEIIRKTLEKYEEAVNRLTGNP